MPEYLVAGDRGPMSWVGDRIGIQMKEFPNRPLFPLEVAKYFGVSKRTVYVWIKKKKIKHIHTPGGHLRIPKESLERFEQEKNI